MFKRPTNFVFSGKISKRVENWKLWTSKSNGKKFTLECRIELVGDYVTRVLLTPNDRIKPRFYFRTRFQTLNNKVKDSRSRDPTVGCSPITKEPYMSPVSLVSPVSYSASSSFWSLFGEPITCISLWTPYYKFWLLRNTLLRRPSGDQYIKLIKQFLYIIGEYFWVSMPSHHILRDCHIHIHIRIHISSDA